MLVDEFYKYFPNCLKCSGELAEDFDHLIDCVKCHKSNITAHTDLNRTLVDNICFSFGENSYLIIDFDLSAFIVDEFEIINLEFNDENIKMLCGLIKKNNTIGLNKFLLLV